MADKADELKKLHLLTDCRIHDHVPWLMLPDEPARWFARFEAYVALGPGRTVLGVYNAERAAAGKPPAKSLPGAWQQALGQFCWRFRAECYDAQQRRDQYEAIEGRRREMVDVQAKALQIMQIKAIEAMGKLDPTDPKWPQVIATLRLVGTQLNNGTCSIPDEPVYNDVEHSDAGDVHLARVAAASRHDWRASKWLLENRHSKLVEARNDGWAFTINEFYEEMRTLMRAIMDVLPEDLRSTVQERFATCVAGTWPYYHRDGERPQKMVRRVTPWEQFSISRPFAPPQPPCFDPYRDWWDDHPAAPEPKWSAE